DVLVDSGFSSHRKPRQRSHDRLVEAVSDARPAVGDQLDFTGLSRLEPHGRSRRNVQAVPESGFAVEGEGRVRLGKMIVAADLDRSVARVFDPERNRRSVLVQDDLASCWKHLARYHLRSPQRIGSWMLTSFVLSGNVASTCSSRIISGTPSMTCSR